MITKDIDSILLEIRQVFSAVSDNQVDELIKVLIEAHTIVAIGAGRVGMMTRAFTMRLGHLGIRAYFLGDTTVPHVGKGDVLLTCSGSGETQTIFDLVEIAKRNGVHVALITGNRDSRMGRLANTIVEVSAPSKTKGISGFVSIQPMTTLNEQCLGILFDAIVLRMMEDLQETHETMWKRHSNLE
ncbi:MAG: 6-phospho-3-hexuloisomerase [bacterium]|nr:6-phospho-3-hexuloisomerase [bacterium]